MDEKKSGSWNWGSFGIGIACVSTLYSVVNLGPLVYNRFQESKVESQCIKPSQVEIMTRMGASTDSLETILAYKGITYVMKKDTADIPYVTAATKR